MDGLAVIFGIIVLRFFITMDMSGRRRW